MSSHCGYLEMILTTNIWIGLWIFDREIASGRDLPNRKYLPEAHIHALAQQPVSTAGMDVRAYTACVVIGPLSFFNSVYVWRAP